MNDETKAFFGIPLTPPPVMKNFVAFIKVDGQLERYDIKAYTHEQAIEVLEQQPRPGGTKLSPVLVLLEHHAAPVSVNDTHEQ